MNPGSSWSLLIAAVGQKSEQRKRLNLAKACRTLEAFDLSMRLLHLVYLLRWKVAFVFGLRACFCQVHVFQCLRLDSESQLQCTTQASSPERKLPVAINIRRSTCCLKRVQKTQNCCSHARGSFSKAHVIGQDATHPMIHQPAATPRSRHTATLKNSGNQRLWLH